MEPHGALWMRKPDLGLVIERITDGVLAIDASWRVSYINLAAKRMLRIVDESDVLGRFWLDAFPKARGRRFEHEYRRAMREQVTIELVEFSPTANAWLEEKLFPSQEGLTAIFRDVSSRIEAQREIERSSSLQQAVIDFGRLALAGLPIEEIGEEAVALLRGGVGADIAEVFLYDWQAQRFHCLAATGWPEHAAHPLTRYCLDHFLSAVESGQPVVMTDMRNDRRLPQMAELTELGITSGVVVPIGTAYQPLGVLAGYGTVPRKFEFADVRFMESIAQTLAEALRTSESNRMTFQVIDSIRDGFVAVDRDLRITYVNQIMAQAYRRTPVQMIGTKMLEYVTDPELAAVALSKSREALASNRAVTFESLVDERWYEVRIYPFADGVAAYVRDVTGRKAEELRVRELNAELERRVQARTKQLELANGELESFSYSVSHDLRAPLRAIDGFSQALADDYGDRLDATATGYLRRVRGAAQRMAALIDAMLTLARVARHEIAFSRVDLSQMAAAIVNDLRDDDPSRTVDAIIEPSIVVFGEPVLLHALLANLLSNAWKFTRNTPHARIELYRGGGEVVVRDNGAGFDMAYANKLFGAFQRLHGVDEYEGTGIGLATVARVVHRHGGSIRAEGEVGRGAAFFFTLPPELPEG